MAIAWTGTQAAGVPPLLAIYNKENPTVHWNLVENVTEEKLLAEEAASDAPSVAMLNTTNLVATMATSTAILPLKPYISSSKLNMDQFTPASLYSNTYLGAQYALPFFEDTYGLYYNKTLFQKAGIAGPPTTLSQLAADAKKLTITGPNGQYTQLGFEPTMPKELEGYLFGGHWASSTGQVTATSPLTEKGVEWLVSMEKMFNPSKVQRFFAGASGAASSLDPFATGTVGMDVSGEWFMPTIFQQSPHLDFGAAPIPYPDGEPQFADTGSVGGNPLVILKGATGHPGVLEAHRLAGHHGPGHRHEKPDSLPRHLLRPGAEVARERRQPGPDSPDGLLLEVQRREKHPAISSGPGRHFLP